MERIDNGLAPETWAQRTAAGALPVAHMRS
jgi:hypothetical protein